MGQSLRPIMRIEEIGVSDPRSISMNSMSLSVESLCHILGTPRIVSVPSTTTDAAFVPLIEELVYTGTPFATFLPRVFLTIICETCIYPSPSDTEGLNRTYRPIIPFT